MWTEVKIQKGYKKQDFVMKQKLEKSSISQLTEERTGKLQSRGLEHNSHGDCLCKKLGKKLEGKWNKDRK